MQYPRYILTLSCLDAHGIVAAVSGFLAENGGFIIESAQHGDASTEQFFMRTEFEMPPLAPEKKQLASSFQTIVADRFGMRWALHDKTKKPRAVILVSRHGHCLNDLLYRVESNILPIEICAVISNHPDFKERVQWHDIAFHHLPILPGRKEAQEQQMLTLIDDCQPDMVVLARYMQILSPPLCEALVGRAINIHHSFLPGFKGANPYQQAFDRGVKIIGATAHYVTKELDEGPIIEQEVARVDHALIPEDLAAIGRDIECVVLARALKYHSEHRVLLNGKKTVIFK